MNEPLTLLQGRVSADVCALHRQVPKARRRMRIVAHVRRAPAAEPCFPSEKERRLSSSFSNGLQHAARLPGWMILLVAVVAVAITAVVAGYRHTTAEALSIQAAADARLARRTRPPPVRPRTPGPGRLGLEARSAVTTRVRTGTGSSTG